MLSLTKKYEPKTSKDIIGQDESISQLKSFIQTYSKQKKKAALIFGPPGTGKTSSVHALAREMNLEIFELNASDFRNKEQINLKLGSSIGQMSLFSKGKIILIDDIDGLAGNYDRGAVQEITKLMEKSTYPVIFTALDIYNDKLSSLRSKVVMIEFQSLSASVISPFLEKICKAEKIQCTDEVLKSIARRSGGDVRAMINDLDILSAMKIPITKEILDSLGMREKEETIINALLKIFKTTDPKIAKSSFDYVSEDTDEQFLWIDENLAHEYEKPQDLARAYKYISRADIFRRRIRRWQHWRFLSYIGDFLTAGIAVSKDEKYNKFTQYKPTGRLLKIFWANQKSAKKKAIASKIAENTHTSQKEALKSMYYYQQILKHSKHSDILAKELDLDEEEVEWLRK